MPLSESAPAGIKHLAFYSVHLNLSYPFLLLRCPLAFPVGTPFDLRLTYFLCLIVALLYTNICALSIDDMHKFQSIFLLILCTYFCVYFIDYSQIFVYTHIRNKKDT